MKTFTLLLSGFLLFSATQTYSQSVEIPKSYTLKTKEDYVPYEKTVIEIAKWLVKIPLDEQLAKRVEASKFIMDWVNGSPTVNVELNEAIMDFNKKNDGMLIIYMASSAKYVLENNYSKDMRAKHRAALRDMIAVYKNSTGIKKDKKMEKLIKMEEAGKLDEWLNENLKISK